MGNDCRIFLILRKFLFKFAVFALQLAGCQSAADLARSPLAGAMLETWAYGQLLRSFTNAGIDPQLYYFRNLDGAEVDFLLEYNQCLYPMEVKQSTRPIASDLKGLHRIPAALNGMHPGIVLCTATRIEKLNTAGALSYPISAL